VQRRGEELEGSRRLLDLEMDWEGKITLVDVAVILIAERSGLVIFERLVLEIEMWIEEEAIPSYSLGKREREKLL